MPKKMMTRFVMANLIDSHEHEEWYKGVSYLLLHVRLYRILKRTIDIKTVIQSTSVMFKVLKSFSKLTNMIMPVISTFKIAFFISNPCMCQPYKTILLRMV